MNVETAGQPVLNEDPPSGGQIGNQQFPVDFFGGGSLPFRKKRPCLIQALLENGVELHRNSLKRKVAAVASAGQPRPPQGGVGSGEV